MADLTFALIVTIDNAISSRDTNAEELIAGMLACCPDGARVVRMGSPGVQRMYTDRIDAGKYRQIRALLAEG